MRQNGNLTKYADWKWQDGQTIKGIFLLFPVLISLFFLRSAAGIVSDEFQASAAYIQGWLKRLKDNKRFIVYAGTQAQKAVDYILQLSPDEKLQEPTLHVEGEVVQ